jgi:pimeloyl-ACP methyl ester carboxylesterase
MPSTSANGITIEYETAGDRTDPALLLIMGLNAQLISWDDDLVAALVARRFFVIRYDNRDVGRSTWFDEAGVPDVLGLLTGEAKARYVLTDMAADAAGLLDALGLVSAHVVGASMGGMIAQTLAIEHPERVRTLVSIMSTTGDHTVGQPSEAAVAILLRAEPTDRTEAVERAVEVWRLLGSPGFPFHEDRLRAEAGASYDRAYHPEGTARQLAATVASPDRTSALRSLKVPTLVIHGEADQLIDVSGGRATAAAIPGAQLWTIPGMGHNFPPELFEEFAKRIAAHAHPHDS